MAAAFSTSSSALTGHGAGLCDAARSAAIRRFVNAFTAC
jgi:hypothetical protein